MQQSSNGALSSFKLEDIPYARMYATMSQIDNLNGDIGQNSDVMVDALRPELDSDIEEVVWWVHNLLWRMRVEVCHIQLEA